MTHPSKRQHNGVLQEPRERAWAVKHSHNCGRILNIIVSKQQIETDGCLGNGDSYDAVRDESRLLQVKSHLQYFYFHVFCVDIEHSKVFWITLVARLMRYCTANSFKWQPTCHKQWSCFKRTSIFIPVSMAFCFNNALWKIRYLAKADNSLML